MKIAALVIMLFGLVTAIYGLVAVVPRYAEANRAYTSTSPYGKTGYAAEAARNIESRRDELRSRSQSYAMSVVACAVVAFVLTLIGRKRPKPPTALLIAGSVLCGVLVIVMQAMGNIF